MVNIHEILRLAAEDSEQAYNDNLNREPSMRMSRAGLPLLQLVMEDFILPKLPSVLPEQPVNSGTLQKSIRREMAISTGFLYEKVVGQHLYDEYNGQYEVWSQQKLEYKGITGTADYLLIDHQGNRAIVVECKALDVQSLTEAKENKLLVDNWGYLTQMCLYLAAVRQKYPEYTVEGQWRLWAKKISKSFTYKYQTTTPDEQTDTALWRAEAYEYFKAHFVKGSSEDLAKFVLKKTNKDHLPLRSFHYGHLTGSCGFHFSPWAAAILDEDGCLLSDADDRLRKLIEYVFIESPTDKQKKSVLSLLDNQDYLGV